MNICGVCLRLFLINGTNQVWGGGVGGGVNKLRLTPEIFLLETAAEVVQADLSDLSDLHLHLQQRSEVLVHCEDAFEGLL